MEEAPAERGVSNEQEIQASNGDAGQSSVIRDEEDLDANQMAKIFFSIYARFKSLL